MIGFYNFVEVNLLSNKSGYLLNYNKITNVLVTRFFPTIRFEYNFTKCKFLNDEYDDNNIYLVIILIVTIGLMGLRA